MPVRLHLRLLRNKIQEVLEKQIANVPIGLRCVTGTGTEFQMFKGKSRNAGSPLYKTFINNYKKAFEFANHVQVAVCGFQPSVMRMN